MPKRTVEYNNETYTMGQYLTYEEVARLKNSLGILRWIKLMSGEFEIKLEPIVVSDLPDMKEVWVAKTAKGIFIEYRHGIEMYLPEPGEEHLHFQ